MNGWRTKDGVAMRPAIAERLLQVLADPQNVAKSQVAIARLANISVRTLRSYSTPELLQEAATLRGNWLTPASLAEVDRAVLAKAREGNVAAARLIYMRLAGQGGMADFEADEPPTLEELEAELARLKGKV